jgi:hypothetical protein
MGEAPDYYVWEVAGKPVVVHLHLEVVDRMLAEVMRGFAAVPKRGAEVGGILIGTIEQGSRTIVRIEDFEPVECGYKRGPSYLFDAEDRAGFEHSVRRWEPDLSRPAYAVGFFRSHTRDGMSLAGEDLALIDDFFPSPAQVALLIRPYGTKVSMAGFFFREDGAFQTATPLEFPFRRRELTGEEAPPRRSMIERRPRAPRDLGPAPPVLAGPGAMPGALRRLDPDEDEDEPQLDPRQAGPAYAVMRPSKSRFRSGMWIPLSFVFLLFGIALGLMIGFMRAPGARDASDFSLGLSVTRAEDSSVVDSGAPKETGFNLSVKWDRQSAVVRAAQRGMLEIQDGKYTKSVDLDIPQLQNGSIIYRNSSQTVRFRLTVYPQSRLSVAETVEWKQ